MSLLEILGNYYDSAADNVVKVADNVSFDIMFRLDEIVNNGISFKTFLESNNMERELTSYNIPDLMGLCNSIEPGFYVNHKARGNHVVSKEKFTFRAIIDGETYTFDSFSNCTYKEVLKQWLSKKLIVPKEFTISFQVSRTSSKELRRIASLDDTGGKEPKDYFAEVCDASFNTSNGTPKSRWGVKNAFKRGTIKYSIVNRRIKESGIFITEYLYGVKIPKNATYEEYFKRLANRPQTDFGIKDVQVLKRLQTIISSRDIVEVAKSLKAINVQPKTNLSRWYKKNEGLEEIVNSSSTLAQK